LLATFLGVDRFLVRSWATALVNAGAAARAAEERLYRARTEASRAAQIAAVLGGEPSAEEASRAPIAIDYLNGLLAKRGLRQVELRALPAEGGAHGEPIQLTVQGGYERLVLFLRDLESSQVPIWLRDVRISEVDEGAVLEMRVRLEIEGTAS
jgi:hypothetical protein